jgi:guanylate kinase
MMAGRRGLLLVVSSPSGAGKTTLCRRLVREHPSLRFSVSYTTRAPRTGEIDGVDYHFVSDETFERMVQGNAFAEWAFVHGRRYGTAVATVREALARGGEVLFDVDYQGAERLKEQFPEEAILVYILPPSLRTLEQRLRGRGTDAPDVIERRLRKAREELRHYHNYHYLVVNDDIERAYGELQAVYLAARGAAPGEASAGSRACALPARAALAEALLAEGEMEEAHGADPL